MLNTSLLKSDLKTLINSIFNDNKDIYFNEQWKHLASDNLEKYIEKQMVK